MGIGGLKKFKKKFFFLKKKKKKSFINLVRTNLYYIYVKSASCLV
jgi:hypothetical protein